MKPFHMSGLRESSLPFLKRVLPFVAASLFLQATVAQSQVSSPPSAAECNIEVAYGSVPAGCELQTGTTPQLTFPSASSANALGMAPSAPAQLPNPAADASEQVFLAPRNPNAPASVKPVVRPRTEFEQLVADTVGRPLPLFGQSFFEKPPSTFAPTTRVQVPDDYVIGPDDELQIRVWGQLNADLRVTVDRSGRVYIPKVGQVSVSGVRYSQLGAHLKAELQKYYHNFELSASVGRIRSIQVYVVGQAQHPGTYTISSLSTLVNAIFAAGGPSPNGSLRDVQVQRAGATVAHMDFYELLVKGDKSRDVRLQSGDVIFFPPVGPLAAVAGSVNAVGIYEMRSSTTLGELLETAGGLSNVADASKIVVERLGSTHEHTVREFSLDAEARAMPVGNGDIVRVLSRVPRYGNAVTLRGNVANPGRYPWRPGMHVRDLISNVQALLPRAYWMDRATLTDARSTEYPLAKGHPVPLPGQTTVDPLTGKPLDPNVLIARGADVDYTNRKIEPKPNAMKDSSSASAAAEVEDEAAATRQKPNTETLTRDLHRAAPEINWHYAIVQRVNPEDLSTRLIAFDLAGALLENNPADNLELQADDIVTVFSQADVAVPEKERTRFVRVEGEVARPGVYKVEEGELLRAVLERAGGLTPQAYVYGTELTRESARLQQQKSLDELVRNLEVEIRQAAVANAARGTSEDAAAMAAQQSSQQALISQLRAARASGRVVLMLAPGHNTLGVYPGIALEDNDRIVVPHMPSTVSVMGMVYNPGSFVFDDRRTVGGYLKLAGRGRPNADMRHAYVLRADGSVVASRSVNGAFSGGRFEKLRLHPGDQVIVPSKIQTGSFIRGLRDWTQISSQLALTGAAVAVLK